MYQIGDKVIYGAHGVCSVVEQENRVLDKKTVTYLVLEPAGQDGSRYLVPTHNEAAMAKLHPMLCASEMEELLHSRDIREGSWIQDENRRKQLYRELITSGDRAALLKMLYSLYEHKSIQLAAGKKVHLADDNFLRDAEKLVSSEISVVMNLSAEEAKAYLRAELHT